MSLGHDATNYEPFNGDLISGSPSLLNRYITTILAKGAHFQFIDGETLEVIVPGAGQAIVTSFGDTVVAAKEENKDSKFEEKVEDIVEAVAEANELAEDPAPGIDPITVEAAPEYEEVLEEAQAEVAAEAPAPKPARGRKPKAAPAAEPVEGE